MLSAAGQWVPGTTVPEHANPAGASPREEDYAAKMSTNKKSTSKKLYGPLVPGWIFHSKAYRSLKTKYARYIYDILRSQLIDKKLSKAERKARANSMGKPGMHTPNANSDFINKRNWNELRLSYRKLMNYWGLKNARTIKVSFTELHEHGLIDIIHKGGGFEGEPAIYAMSERYEKYGLADFEWPILEPDPHTGRIGYRYEAKVKPDNVIQLPMSIPKPKQKRRLII